MEVEMKMVKSLLLGTAAGLVAVAGAQAADMPVKAKPVLYVKICTLYGDGYYYIPGTDTCIKIGGYLRFQTEYNSGSSGQPVGTSGSTLGMGRFTRDNTSDVNFTNRAVVSFDVRNQSEYGVVRSYARVGWDVRTPQTLPATTTPPNSYIDRAFIQFAGFTVGRAQSFFDLFSFGGQWSYLNSRTLGDTGANGQDLWAYTVQFGNGFSATASLEAPSTHTFGTMDLNGANLPYFAGNVNDTAFDVNAAGPGGFRTPNIVLNARVDQAWGYAGISGVVGDSSGAYYLSPNLTPNGHPANKYGWGINVGGQLNLPGGDGVGIGFVWTEGMPALATNSPNFGRFDGGTAIGIANIVDGVFANGTEVELTRAWSVNAGYQHIWGPAGTWGHRWRTSLYGGYVHVDYNDNATFLINSGFAAGNVCRPAGAVGGIAAPGGITPLLGNSCSPDFNYWLVGSRTQFNPHPLLDIGLDLFYSNIQTAYAGPANFAGSGSQPGCVNTPATGCSIADQGVVSALMRWQRNFYP
jgi:Porin subfamily